MESKFVVKTGGSKLFAFLKERLKGHMPVKGIKRLIDGKAVRVNGKIVFLSSFLLNKGDVIEIFPLVQTSVKEEPFPILYEDAHLLIINKFPGVACTPEEIKKHLPKGKSRVYLVHRLDKETSGVLLLAKNGAAQKALEKMFKEKKISKRYLAVVAGTPKKEEGEIDTRIGIVKQWKGQTQYGSGDYPEAKRAVTRWKVLKKGKRASLLLVMPQTGRTHQIRVHLSELGHPILGDAQYGPRISSELVAPRHLLHAYQISFLKPWDKEELLITAPLPEDFLSI